MHPIIARARDELLKYSQGGYQTSGDRSIAYQAQLYDEWRRGLRRYPVAPPGRSMHNYGRAFDLFAHNLPELGRIWTAWGGRWGGESDPVHFEA